MDLEIQIPRKNRTKSNKKKKAFIKIQKRLPSPEMVP